MKKILSFLGFVLLVMPLNTVLACNPSGHTPLPPLPPSPINKFPILSGFWKEDWQNPMDPAKINALYNVFNIPSYSTNTAGALPVLLPSLKNNKANVDHFLTIEKARTPIHIVLLSLGGKDGAGMQMHWNQQAAFQKNTENIFKQSNQEKGYDFDGINLNLQGNAINAGDNPKVICTTLNNIQKKWRSQGRHFYITMTPDFPCLKTTNVESYQYYLQHLNYDWIQPRFYDQGDNGVVVPQSYKFGTNWPGGVIKSNNVSYHAEFLYLMAEYLTNGPSGDPGNNNFVHIDPWKFLIGVGSSLNTVVQPNTYFTWQKIETSYNMYFRYLSKFPLTIRGLMIWTANDDLVHQWNFAHVFQKTWEKGKKP